MKSTISHLAYYDSVILIAIHCYLH